jgi:hypothetical protein
MNAIMNSTKTKLKKKAWLKKRKEKPKKEEPEVKLVDKVQFGEVAHEPPIISVRPKPVYKQKLDSARQDAIAMYRAQKKHHF